MTLEDIYREHVQFAWRALRRHGVAPADMADAVQDVFLTVHRTLEKFEGRSSLKTWLYTICASVARDRRERAYRRHETAGLDDVGELIDLRASAEARAEHNVRLELLEAALREMGPALGEIFVLFEVEELSGQQISDALAIPLGTVYSRLNLAREAFRRVVGSLDQSSDSGPPARRQGDRA
jgi:RNA polymerase sigma-70 factor (ECF subfamily)